MEQNGNSQLKNLQEQLAASVPKKTLYIWITVLVVFLFVALGFLGYVLQECFGGSCNKQCDSSKMPSCPVGYTPICNPCSGHYYCGETQCNVSSDCTKDETLSKKEDRTICNIPDGASKGYCNQCKDDNDCKSAMKCHNGWCSLCTTDSDCTTDIYDAKENGVCTNNVCVFKSGCNQGDPVAASTLAPIWPYTTDAYNVDTYPTCNPLKSQ